MRITTIGTCRVHHPFRAARAELGYDLSNHGLYGFVHAAPEILQQIAFVRGEFRYPSWLSPFIADNADVQPGYGLDADEYVVEISSRKLYEYSETILQQNRTSQKFKDLAGLAEVVSRHGKDLSARQVALDALDGFLYAGTSVQVLARSMTIRQVSNVELRLCMQKILDELDGHVTFVTHCGALAKDGSEIGGRRELIEGVQEAAIAIGARVYNPTELMKCFGQDRAMPPGDVNHYTSEFQVELARDLYKVIQSYES
jgi:hypothetical protein